MSTFIYVRTRIFLDDISSEIDEAGAGPSRIVQHIHSGAVFIMLSAMRGDLPHAENPKRTVKLKRMLEDLPVSYILVHGSADCYEGDWRE